MCASNESYKRRWISIVWLSGSEMPAMSCSPTIGLASTYGCLDCESICGYAM